MVEADSIPFYPRCLARCRAPAPVVSTDDGLLRRVETLGLACLLAVAVLVGAHILSVPADGYAPRITAPAPKLVRVGYVNPPLCWPDPKECG